MTTNRFMKRPEKREDRPRFFAKRRVCSFCVDKVEYIDYKDVEKIRRYITERARIATRRRGGACAKHQRGLATAIKRGRFLALLPYTPDHMRRVSFTAAQ